MRILKMLIPPDNWKLPVGIMLGAFVGIFIYLFNVSNASSYISDAPKTCINCHIMEPQYATWFHSSHRENATCNDCHVPQDNFIRKYYFKGKDGLRHATVFTLRNEPQVIQIKHEGIYVVQENCIRCHSNLNNEIKTINVTGENYKHGAGKLCWECHREVPHGRVNSLSSTPNAIIPEVKEPLPVWLKKLISE